MTIIAFLHQLKTMIEAYNEIPVQKYWCAFENDHIDLWIPLCIIQMEGEEAKDNLLYGV